jgi:hypothetical protein
VDPARLAAALTDVVDLTREDDGALTVRHDGTIASLRVVAIADDLELVSLTQILAWDQPLDNRLRSAVLTHAHTTLLGTVSLAAKKKTADVLLRYNFPATGLPDEALRTLVLLVLANGAEVRRALVD